MFKTIWKEKIPRTAAQCGIIRLAILNQTRQDYAHATSHSQIVWVQKNVLQTHSPKQYLTLFEETKLIKIDSQAKNTETPL